MDRFNVPHIRQRLTQLSKLYHSTPKVIPGRTRRSVVGPVSNKGNLIRGRVILTKTTQRNPAFHAIVVEIVTLRRHLISQGLKISF